MTPHFFGYGSLVNRQTHDYKGVFSARLDGWERVWCHTGLRDVAFLSVRPAAGVAIDGLIAHVPNGDWAALDEREWVYDRRAASGAVSHGGDPSFDVAYYVVPDHSFAEPSVKHPILLSYLDVVVQGYLREFGEAGVRAFFDSTAGWDAPMVDDRADPIYPRHQRLSPSELALVDAELARVR